MNSWFNSLWWKEPFWGDTWWTNTNSIELTDLGPVARIPLSSGQLEQAINLLGIAQVEIAKSSGQLERTIILSGTAQADTLISSGSISVIKDVIAKLDYRHTITILDYDRTIKVA